jgi:hypothetical protein
MPICASFVQANPLARLYVTLLLYSVFTLPKYVVKYTEFVEMEFYEIGK